MANKVRQGAARLLVKGRELHFVTLTLGRGPAGETHAEMVERLMVGWRNLRQGWWWREHGPEGPFFRVVESGTHTGRPHLHAVVAGSLPYVRAPRDRESLESWRADLGPDALGMVAALERAGLGPICHAEHLHGGGQGAATYLGGYLSKSEKRLARPDGQTVRVAEGSRTWPAAEHDNTTYAAGAVAIEPAGRVRAVRAGAGGGGVARLAGIAAAERGVVVAVDGSVRCGRPAGRGCVCGGRRQV